MPQRELKAQILIVGASTGGVAAALSASALGDDVILTEETDWIGGQLTSQAVPPDEHPWIESFGCTRRYRALRDGIRQWYRDHRALTDAARRDPRLNPGGGAVSHLCHEPKVSLAVMTEMLQPQIAKGNLKLLLEHKPISAAVAGDAVKSITLRNLKSGDDLTITADYILDATDLGDLLPLAQCEYIIGAESKREMHEPHAPDNAQPENVQSFTWCFPAAFDPAPGANHLIDKPEQYERWQTYTPHLTPPWPGRLLSWTYSQPVSLKPTTRPLFAADHAHLTLFGYRKIVRGDIYRDDSKPHEVTLVNWPQNDYWEHNIIDKPAEDVAVWLEESRQLSLSLLYWMQTEAPRHDGRQGYPELYLVPDLVGTKDGLAKSPYIRESRRIKAMFTVTENHVGSFARYGKEENVLKLPPGHRAEPFADSIGIGYYRIDLHPSTGGKNYVDISSLPFQIPLGALIPQRMENLLPACKNLGVTHITNGCYRLHPVEWNIGESAGLLAAFCITKKVRPREVRENKPLLVDFQQLLLSQGIELEWPREVYPSP